MKIFSNAQENPEESREELYNSLKDMYVHMSQFKLKQLHFHLPSNESFLRFHRPKKYGDDLSNIRLTVAHVNKTKEFISGFEEGRIFNGYRYVFPLSYENKHIGSVETSVSMKHIIESLKNLIDADIEFLLEKSVVEKKVFLDEQSNYEESKVFNQHVIEKSVSNHKENQILNKLLEKNKEFVGYMELHDDNAGIINSMQELYNKTYILTIIPVKQAITKKVVAHLVISKEHPGLNFMNMQKFAIVLFIILLLGVATLNAYKLEKKRMVIENQKSELESSREKLQKLFDLQKNIIIVSNGHELKFANKAMYDFFGIENIEEFKKSHKDISEKFIEIDLYFNLKKISDSENWIKAIEPLNGDKKVVSMLDTSTTPHAFNVSVSKLNKNEYIVSFTDITSTMIEKLDLGKKAIEDRLTHAYNREYFYTHIESVINSLGENKLGLVIFDIDHFKAVNDTYGHNTGDYILKELSKITKLSIRKEDTLIRWGGEEFILLIKVDELASLKRATEHVRQRIDNYKFNKVNNITCSFGCTLYMENENIEATIKRADENLYKAKNNGRNQVVAS